MRSHKVTMENVKTTNMHKHIKKFLEILEKKYALIFLTLLESKEANGSAPKALGRLEHLSFSRIS